jgi:hypothetical protein
MVHQCEGLPLGLEAADDLGCVHPRLDNLQGDLAPYGRLLLGEEDDAHAAFAPRLDELVGPDAGAWTLELRMG